jgi:hypothetical protein
MTRFLQSSTEKINYLLHENYQLKEKINEKYAFLVAAKEIEIIQINKNSFNLNFKTSDLNVLSYHPKDSYRIIKKGKISIFRILNESRFWNGSNYLIIRIKKRKLY